MLLDKNYQLAFTAVLVLTCALFMAGLGWLVLKEADTATQTAIQNVQGSVLDADVAADTIANLERRRALLGWILVGLGVGLTGALFAYGIKMTHHLAGPLYKISHYCDRVVEDGKFAELTGLRRHDQLVDLYGHFKEAIDTLRARQLEEVQVLRELIEAAEALPARPPEVEARLAELRALLSAKEVTLA